MAKAFINQHRYCCEEKYEGLMQLYTALSECAHPNYEGICFGYSDVNPERHETHFSNMRLSALHLLVRANVRID